MVAVRTRGVDTVPATPYPGPLDAMSPLRILAWALPLALLTALALLLAQSRTSRPESPNRAAGGAPPSDFGFPRTIATSDAGEVFIPRAPRRVVVANTSLVDAVTALVPPDRVAALPRQAETWSAIARDPGEFADVPRFSVFVAEVVLAYEPDLVLCSVHSQPETVTTLRDVAVPTIRFGFPEDLAAVRADLRLVARLLGAEEQLAELDEDLDARIAALRDDRGERAGTSASFYAHDGSEGWSSGSRTAADEILDLAGLRNATAAAGHVGPVRLTFEQLLAIDPDVLVVPREFGEVDGSTDRVLDEEDALRALRAVKDGRIVHLHPSLFSTTSHEIVTAAERLAEEIDSMARSRAERRDR